MMHRKPVAGLVCLLCAGAGLLPLEPAAAAAAHPAPRTAGRAVASATYVKEFGAIVNGSLVNLSPVDVQPTFDGGAIALAQAGTAQGLGTDWLVKLGATGAPQWQEEVGCASPQDAPGDGANGVSVQQTADGGYVVGGGTIDCGSGSSCPPLSGQSCAFAVKLSPAGDVTWARVYQAGPGGSEINQIRQTADGGYVAVGSLQDLNQDNNALILKLDSAGNVVWQRDLGSARRQAIFDGVQQTAAGGYVAAGEYYILRPGEPPTQVLVAKFTANGHLSWQRGFARTSGGSPTSVAGATSVLATPDGGYAVAGRWSDKTFNGNNGAKGALLLKLDSGGNLQWQRAYSGGVYCYDNGFSETCAAVGGDGYSLHRTSDGGYVLAGDSNLELSDEAPIAPWQAKVDASGNLLWQHLYYQTYTTGRPLSEFFPASARAPGGGFLSAGPTENYPAQKDELFAVRTDGAGLAGNCADVHAATPLQAISPQLTATAPALPVHLATTAAVSSPMASTATGITTGTDC